MKNIKALCETTLKPFRKKGNISNYIQIWSYIGPSYIQGLAIIAALQEETVENVFSQ